VRTCSSPAKKNVDKRKCETYSYRYSSIGRMLFRVLINAQTGQAVFLVWVPKTPFQLPLTATEAIYVKAARRAQKTTDFSTSGCRGSSIRGLCAHVRQYSPRLSLFRESVVTVQAIDNGQVAARLRSSPVKADRRPVSCHSSKIFRELLYPAAQARRLAHLPSK
jgi:hypothetical protein